MFLHFYHPSAILLDLNFIQIHWYGFIITLAGLAGFFVFRKLVGAYCNTPLQKIVFKSTNILNLFFWLIIAAIIGGRLYHVLSEINYYWQRPLEIFYLWQGGMGIFGAIIASIITIYIFLIRHKNYSLRITDYGLLLLDTLAPALALGQSIGRWGNYFNQELYGLPTNLPWGIPIDFSNRLSGYENFIFFHPLFLYESLFCLMLFFFLVNTFCHSDANQNPEKKNLISFWIPFKLPLVILNFAGMTKKGNLTGMVTIKTPGTIFLLYLFLYSFWRFFIEFLRLDPQPIFLNLRLGQWVSLCLIIISIIFYFSIKKRYNKTVMNNEQ